MTVGGIDTEHVRLVAAHEFRMRLRTGRWKWLLAGWLVLVGLFTLLLDMTLRSQRDHTTYYDAATGGMVRDTAAIGPSLFGALMLFVLSLTLLVSPSLTAQSVNGDRERGTLAALQATLLTPAEIAVGKLLAGWSVGLTALGLTLPFVLWSVVEGGVGIVEVLVTLAVMALLTGVVCAVSQAMSAVLPRAVASGLMSYLAVAALTIGTLVVYFLSLGLTDQNVVQTYRDTNGGIHTVNAVEDRPDHVWWLLAPNPFVVLADAAPGPAPRQDDLTGAVNQTATDPLNNMRDSIRATRRTPAERDCLDQGPDACRLGQPPALWPWGLGFDVAMGGFALWVTVRRLRTPTKGLAAGERIA